MADESRPLTIGVLGSYGGLNIGDEAILACVLRCLRAVRPSAAVVVFTRNASHTAQHHAPAETVAWEGMGRAQTLQAVAKLDLLILGGGGILYDREARRYLQIVGAAQDQRIPTFGYAMGAGPLRDPEDRAVVGATLNRMTDIVVRDEESKLVLERAGVDRDITVTADPALLLPRRTFTSDMLMREGIPTGGRLVAMSVREPGAAAEHLDSGGYHALLAEVADFLVRRLDAFVVFIPMERQDISHSHAVLSKMSTADRGRILNGDYTPAQVLGFMEHVDVAVGMRLHFVMFAALAGVPFLPLPYAGKVFDFAQTTGAPTLTGVAREQAGLLLAEVDRMWDEYPARRDALRSRVARLRTQARTTCDRCRAVLERIEHNNHARYPVSG
ncbi:MAG: hypothetical protein JWR32_1440 [Mycobacterium sp.]|nr:hypothetical protein [Mycobacterium sp.]